ncbi:Heparan N-sulfatase [Planctomycetales bacterium 10988]|nr:Heparan N-sulfatase [Planctomycetales bacterium 10988]
MHLQTFSFLTFSRLGVACFLVIGLLWAEAVMAKPDKDAPNILFCIADDASYPHMGAYGCDWVKTPAFDRVAAEGILFTNAYTPNAKCAPSRAAILTGRNSWQLKEAANHFCYFPQEFKSYVEALGEYGYFVGKTAKGWAPGMAKDANGKPRNLAGTPFNKKRIKRPTTGISTVNYAGNFEDFVEASEGKPWCFWYGGYEPHRSYEYGTGAKLGGKSPDDVDRVPGFWPDNKTVRNDMLDYAFEIEHFDRHLGQMLDLLEETGQLENTLVVVTADNGMPFPRVKGQEYEMSNHLPLAIMWPKGIKNPGRTVNDYVSFIDFAPTFLEAAGLKWKRSGMAPTPGRSLTDIFGSKRDGRVVPERNFVLIGKERHDVGRPHDQGYPIRGIVQDGMLYLKNYETSRWPACNPETGYLNTDASPTKTIVLNMRTETDRHRFWQWCFGKRPAEELYNVQHDPDCLDNLIDRPDFHQVRTELADRMTQMLQDQQDPRMFGKGEVFDNYVYSSEATRNFYERYMSGEDIKAGWVNLSDFEDGPLDE